jgi:hypothetical protein
MTWPHSSYITCVQASFEARDQLIVWVVDVEIEDDCLLGCCAVQPRRNKTDVSEVLTASIIMAMKLARLTPYDFAGILPSV